MRHLATLLFTVLLVMLGGCGGGAEGELGTHIENLTEIMEDEMDAPEDGVDELTEYLEDNLPGAMSLIAEAMVELNRIEDTSDRSERLKEMLDEIEAPLKELGKVAEQFGKSVEKDAEASKKMSRLTRTWEEMADTFDEFGRKLSR